MVIMSTEPLAGFEVQYAASSRADVTQDESESFTEGY